MGLSLLIKPEAEADINDAYFWYEDKQVGLGISFIDELDQLFIHIRDYPKAFEIRYRKTRMAFTDRFPFGVHYKIERKTIIILAVLHTSKNPKRWKEIL